MESRLVNKSISRIRSKSILSNKLHTEDDSKKQLRHIDSNMMKIKLPIQLISIYLFILCVFINPTNCSQTQKFLKRPKNINVKLGDTAMLDCSVSSTHGDVQWTHDGTALGYDRNIPGKPRYSVIWHSDDSTEYHLKIENVTMTDEGLFSCQAAPIGDWDTKLEAKAKLTVLVGPENPPEITFEQETRKPGDIVNFKTKSKTPTEYTCIVRKAKPAGIIKWFLDGVMISSKIGYAKSTKTKDAEGMEDLKSVLKLKEHTKAIHNNSVIECQAYHEAFGIRNKLANLSTTLRIVVVHPPSKPEIGGYDFSTGVIAGSELKLICASKYTYPSAMLSWYRDGKLISKNYDTIDSLKTTESIYRIGKVTPLDNKALFKCDSINQAMDEPYSTNMTLNVLYGPSKLTMKGVFEVEAGKEISAMCFSDAANPSPQLRFSFDGHDYEPNSFSSKPTDAKIAKGAYTVNGTFYRTVQQEHNNKELKCYAENKLANVQQIVTQMIKVLYPPDILEIIYAHENKTINEGTKVYVTCISRGGNPLPDITWTLSDATKLTTAKTQSIIYTRESVLELTLDRKHHNKFITCKAANKVGSLSKSVKLNVAYLPSKIDISIIEPTSKEFQLFSNITIKAGTRSIFSCRAPNSNPRAEITWSKNSFPITLKSASDGQTNQTAIITKKNEYDTVSYISFDVQSGDHLKEIRCDVRVGSIKRIMHGSLLLKVKFPPEILIKPEKVISIYENKTFTLNLTSRANPSPTYSCSATNKANYTLTNTTLLTFKALKTDNTDFTCKLSNAEGTTNIKFRLDVKFPPIVKAKKPIYITTVGKSVQLSCEVQGNPLETKHITWKLNNKILTNRNDEQHYSVKFVPPNLSILTIDNVRDSDDGNFTCHVNNRVGRSAYDSTELRVKRIPTILVDKSVLKAGEDGNIGRSAKFECRARGYPDVKFKWKQPSNVNINNSSKYVMEYRKESSQIYVSILTVTDVISKDYGSYLCEARSEIGATAEKAVLSGKHQPEQPSDFRVVNITRNAIMLQWKKNFDGGDPQKFRIRYRKDTMDPTYRYIETNIDVTNVLLDHLETATRYVINIQSLNRFGTDGFLRDPLVVQTDFGFNEVNQMPIYNENNLPLTIILVVCGIGTMLLLFNVALIVYLIKRKKKKGEADSTTDTNETDANIVEMFSPPPPYPDELEYQFNLNNNNFEDEYKPFVPHLHQNNHRSSSQKHLHNKYLKDLNDHSDYAFAYASPIPQSWPNEQNEICDDDIHISSLRQLDHNISTALMSEGNMLTVKPSRNQMSASMINTPNRLVNQSFGSQNTSNSFHMNLNQLASNGENYLMETARAFPYERLSQANSGAEQSAQVNKNNNNNNNNVNPNIHTYRANSNCKIYQDVDEFKGHLV